VTAADGHVDDRLSAYLDGELPALEQAAVETHLGSCEACAGRLGQLASVDEAVRALALDTPEGYFDDFAARVRGRLDPPRKRALPAWTWAAAAVLLLAVVTPLTVRRLQEEDALPVPAAAKVVAPTSKAERNGGSAASRPADGVASPTEPAPAVVPIVPRAPEPAFQDAAPEQEEAASPASDGRADAPRHREAAAAEAQAPAEKQAPAEAKTRSAASGDGGARKPAFVPPSAPAGFAAPPAAPPPAAAAARAPARGGPVVQNQAPVQAQSPARDAVQDEELGKPSTRDEGGVRPFAARPSSPDSEGVAGAAVPAAPEEAAAGMAVAEGVPSGAAPETARQQEKDAGAAAARGRNAVAMHKEVAGAEEAQFQRLLAERPRSLQEFRAAREAWRAFSVGHPAGPRADEARVQVIAMGAAAWRQGHDSDDAALARRDAAAYLARTDAVQGDRVRRVLADLDARR
jgi:hypothetical protein